MSKAQSLMGFLGLRLLGPVIIVLLLRVFKMPVEVAGALFIFIGFAMVIPMMKWSQFRSSPLFLITVLYIVVGLLLYGARLARLGEAYNTFSLFGLPASIFHHITEVLYVALVGLTLFEIYKNRLSNKASV